MPPSAAHDLRLASLPASVSFCPAALGLLGTQAAGQKKELKEGGFFFRPHRLDDPVLRFT